MRDIQRLERMVLDAIEQLPDPTLAEIVDYVRARRRVWIWTHAGILVAVFRLEGNGRIEARRSFGQGGKVRWTYRTAPDTTNDVALCCSCSEPGDVGPGARAEGHG